jgi:hypothetical protein
MLTNLFLLIIKKITVEIIIFTESDKMGDFDSAFLDLLFLIESRRKSF